MAFQERKDGETEFYNDYEGKLEGEIAVTVSRPDTSSTADGVYNTLDEPVKVTILRDVKTVGRKFWHVLYPRQKKALLRDWDLWGPLILCTFLAMMLQDVSNSKIEDSGLEFAEVFVIVWLGAIIVTVNSTLLGGTISFFQSVCVLGYCLLPPSLSLVICRIILWTSNQTVLLFIIRFAVTVIGFTWATFAAMLFLGDSQPPNKKALAIYPVFLFYFIISWMIISHTNYGS